jgi:hypothetical protein
VSTPCWPIVCAWCDRIRTPGGRWEEEPFEARSDCATHGICPDCLADQQQEARAADAAP